ncbi:MAG: VanZ family protein [Lachnospiraceae bacterium]|nr:VanZ family protein [Lachnospiraceae bacterium]
MSGEGKFYKQIKKYGICNHIEIENMQSKKIKYLKILFTALTIAWMGLIFFMSSRNAEQSTDDSNFVIRLIGKIFHSDFEEWDSTKINDYLGSLSLIVRKTAHAGEYAVLCFFAAQSFLQYSNTKFSSKLKMIIAGFVTSVLYAITDEIHQSFVPGRACMAGDVLIDSSGAFAMVILLMLFYVLRQKTAGRKIHQA